MGVIDALVLRLFMKIFPYFYVVTCILILFVL